MALAPRHLDYFSWLNATGRDMQVRIVKETPTVLVLEFVANCGPGNDGLIVPDGQTFRMSPRGPVVEKDGGYEP